MQTAKPDQTTAAFELEKRVRLLESQLAAETKGRLLLLKRVDGLVRELGHRGIHVQGAR